MITSLHRIAATTLCCVGLLSPVMAARAAPAAASAQAQGVFEAARPSVLEVQTLPVGSDSPYSHGTGFAVAGALILTNYHVVAGALIDPDRYRLEFRRQDGGRGALSVVAVDVIHDLALVRGDTGPLPPLAFDERVPEKGTRGYSIGFPRHVGITVTEGVVNGLSADSTRGAIHFSGPVNAGMSGGPALTADGRVFGVNVANLRGSQLISFVVPAVKALALLAAGRAADPPGAPALIADIARQLREHSAATVGPLAAQALPTQAFGHFRAPGKPGEFARCSASNEKEADKLYRMAAYGCRLKDASYVAPELYLGHWDFSHRHVVARGLGAVRFASLQESLLKPHDDTSTAVRLHKTRWACERRILALAGTRSAGVLCVRRYHRLPGLYDVELKLATLADPGESLVSTLSMSGLGYAEATGLALQYLRAIQWAP